MSEKPKKENKLKNIIVVIIPIIFIVAVIAGIFIYKNKESKEKQITYDKLYQDIIDKKVEKIEMTVGGASVTVKYKDSDDEKTTKVNSLQPFMDFINQQLKDGNDLKVDLKSPFAFLAI